MTNDELLMSGHPSRRREEGQAAAPSAAGSPPTPPSGGDGLDGIAALDGIADLDRLAGLDGAAVTDGVDPWVRLGLTRLPDGSGYSYVGRRFTLTINADLDVEFEFDGDPGAAPLEESDLRVGLTALVLTVWRIAGRLRSTSNDPSTPAREVRGPDLDAPGPDPRSSTG